MGMITRAGFVTAPQPLAPVHSTEVSMHAPGVITRRINNSAARMSSSGYDWANPGDPRSRNYVSSSATALMSGSIERIRAACRDLVRNSVHARSAVRVLAANLVRYGIVPKFSGSNKRAQAAQEKEFKAWAESLLCDVKGIHNFYGIMHTVAWQLIEAGECFVRLHVIPDSEAIALGLRMPFQLEVIEAEQVTMESWTAPNGNRVITGIEVDARGRRLAAYPYVGASDPTDTTQREKQRMPFYTPVGGGELIHILDPKRGSYRGEPYLAIAGKDIEAFEVYKRALLTRAQVEACFSGFVKQPAPVTATPGIPNMPFDPALGTPINGGIARVDIDDGAPLEHIQPGMVHYLRPGEEVTFSSPISSGGLEVYARETLRGIAVGIGVPYELLTGDLSDVSYTSFRAGTLQFRDQIEMLQWLVLIPQFCAPIMAAFTFLGYLKGRWDTPAPEGIDYGVPRPASIDPVKDATALLMELKAGITDLQAVKSERGEDWKKGVDTIAAINEYATSQGIIGFLPEGFGGQLAREPEEASQSSQGAAETVELTPRQQRQARKAQAA